MQKKLFIIPSIVLALILTVRAIDARLYNPLTVTGGNLTLGGNLLPNANNTLDLGAFATAFRDIYASGTLKIGGTGTSTISGTMLLLKPAATTTLQLGNAGDATANRGGCIALKDAANNNSFIYLSYDSRVSSGLSTGTSPSVCY